MSPNSCPNTWSFRPYLLHRANSLRKVSSKLSVLKNRRLQNISRANLWPQCSRHPEGKRYCYQRDSRWDRTCRGSQGYLLLDTAQSPRGLILGHRDWYGRGQEIFMSCCTWKWCFGVPQKLLAMSKLGLGLLLGAWINRCWKFHTSPSSLGYAWPQNRCPTCNHRSLSTLDYQNLLQSFRLKLNY